MLLQNNCQGQPSSTFATKYLKATKVIKILLEWIRGRKCSQLRTKIDLSPSHLRTTKLSFPSESSPPQLQNLPLGVCKRSDGLCRRHFFIFYKVKGKNKKRFGNRPFGTSLLFVFPCLTDRTTEHDVTSLP